MALSLSKQKQVKVLLHPLLFLAISHREEYSTIHFASENDDDADALKKKSALNLRCVRNSTPLCTTTIFAPSISVVCYPSISTSATSYSDFVANSRSYDFFTRSYAHFPSMISIPDRPTDAMDHNNLKFHADPIQFKDDDPTPPGAVTEIKFAVGRNPDINSSAPNFKVHNLRAAFQDSDGNIVHLIREPPKNDRSAHKFHMKIAKLLIAEDFKEHNIVKSDLADLWWDERRKPEATYAMWENGLLKHFRFSRDDYISDYASKTYELAHPILRGSEGKPGLGEFLLTEGFRVGKYHEVTALLVALKKFFGGLDTACPTFIGHGGYHPALFEVGVLATKDATQKISHPMLSKVPKGKFLMRHL